MTFGMVRFVTMESTSDRRRLKTFHGNCIYRIHTCLQNDQDNIRYGNLGATDEQIYDNQIRFRRPVSLKMLPDDFDTVISGTEELSGQGSCYPLPVMRQPTVLILDEATFIKY